MEKVTKVVEFGVGLVAAVGLISLDKRYRSHSMQTFIVDCKRYKNDYYPRWFLCLKGCRYIKTSSNENVHDLDCHPFCRQERFTNRYITYEKPRYSLFYRYWGELP